MRFGRILGVALATVVCAGAAFAQAPNLEKMDLVLEAIPDGPVAFVNGVSIGPHAFRDMYLGEATRWAQMNGTPNIPDETRVRLALASLRMLVERELLLQGASAKKLTVSDAELQKRWQEELERMKEGLKRAQAAQGKPEKELTEDDILKMSGSTKEQAQAELRKALLIEKMRDSLLKEKNVTVTDKEIKDFFEQNKERTTRPESCHVIQVFVRVDPKAKDVAKAKAAAKEKIENALKRIRAGESLDKVAREVCEGPLKAQGGDMGLVPVAKMPPFILQEAEKLQPGQVSDVFESEYGFHIVKLIEFVAGEEPNLEKATPEIRHYLMTKKANEVMREFCAESSTDNSIQVFLDLEKQIVTRPKLFETFADAAEAEAPGAPAPAPAAKPAPAEKAKKPK